MDSGHLFYSWQSDRAGKLCRDFIWNALGQADLLVQAQNGVELRLDRDTVGVAGTPPVTDTILAKIRACDIFLGDMSFVGQAEGDMGKLLPNPNVMAEYGFARATKDHAQLQLVMNTAFVGIAGDQFDRRIVDRLVLPMLGKGGQYRSMGKMLDIPNGWFADFGD